MEFQDITVRLAKTNIRHRARLQPRRPLSNHFHEKRLPRLGLPLPSGISPGPRPKILGLGKPLLHLDEALRPPHSDNDFRMTTSGRDLLAIGRVVGLETIRSQCQRRLPIPTQERNGSAWRPFKITYGLCFTFTSYATRPFNFSVVSRTGGPVVPRQ